MSTLALEIPNLSRTTAQYVGDYHPLTQAGLHRLQFLEPWKANPCDFHDHSIEVGLDV